MPAVLADMLAERGVMLAALVGTPAVHVPTLVADVGTLVEAPVPTPVAAHADLAVVAASTAAEVAASMVVVAVASTAVAVAADAGGKS